MKIIIAKLILGLVIKLLIVKQELIISYDRFKNLKY